MTDTTDQRPPDTIVKRPATWSPIFASTMDLSAVRGANFVAVGTWIRVERDVRDVLTDEVVVDDVRAAETLLSDDLGRDVELRIVDQRVVSDE